MPDEFRRQTIANWVGDFGDTAAYRELPAPAKEYAQEVLPAFLERACGARDVEPGAIVEADLKPALLAAATDRPASVRAVLPDLCAAFLTELEAQGRLADGRTLGLYVRALRGALEEAARPAPHRNPGSRIGRNDPCPCGSGLKYKRCCMGKRI